VSAAKGARPADPAPENPGPGTAAAHNSFYLLDERRAADLDSFRHALDALAGLSCNDMDGEEFDARVDRFKLACLFSQLSRRLHDIAGGERGLDAVWLDQQVSLSGQRP